MLAFCVIELIIDPELENMDLSIVITIFFSSIFNLSLTNLLCACCFLTGSKKYNQMLILY